MQTEITIFSFRMGKLPKPRRSVQMGVITRETSDSAFFSQPLQILSKSARTTFCVGDERLEDNMTLAELLNRGAAGSFSSVKSSGISRINSVIFQIAAILPYRPKAHEWTF